jgi:hypothetical protein
MRKISRMSLSSRLVTATLADPRPAPPGVERRYPAPLNRHAGVKGGLRVRQAYPVARSPWLLG